MVAGHFDVGTTRAPHRLPFTLIALYSRSSQYEEAVFQRCLECCCGLGVRDQIVSMTWYQDHSFKHGFVGVKTTRGGQDDMKYHEFDGQNFLPNGPRSTGALRRLIASRRRTIVMPGQG